MRSSRRPVCVWRYLYGSTVTVLHSVDAAYGGSAGTQRESSFVCTHRTHAERTQNAQKADRLFSRKIDAHLHLFKKKFRIEIICLYSFSTFARTNRTVWMCGRSLSLSLFCSLGIARSSFLALISKCEETALKPKQSSEVLRSSKQS